MTGIFPPLSSKSLSSAIPFDLFVFFRSSTSMSDNLSLELGEKMIENRLSRDSDRFGLILALFPRVSSFPESAAEDESFESCTEPRPESDSLFESWSASFFGEIVITPLSIRTIVGFSAPKEKRHYLLNRFPIGNSTQSIENS